MPGRHVNDHQMRLYMKLRYTHAVPVAAAKAGMYRSGEGRLAMIGWYLTWHRCKRRCLHRYLYQGAMSLTHVGDSQAAENLIRGCRHVEAWDGGSDWGSI